MPIELRPAQLEDVDALLDAWEWLFAPPGRRPDGWDRRRAGAALRDAVASHDALVLVAEDDGELVGYCTVYYGPHTIRFGMRAWMEELAVHPERRSEGLGARLLEAGKAWARGRGAAHLKLDSALARTDAHRFYEREGMAALSYSFVCEL
jgi:GNAT superfamily N-acetyltransferase